MRTSFLLFVFLAVPLVALAQQTDYLVGIPGVTNQGQVGMASYINALYLVAISVAALLAVVKIVIAGAKYMLSDVVTNKQDAIKDIRGALLGLLIVLAAFLILNTINEQLIDLEALDGINPVTTTASPLDSGSPNNTPPTRNITCDNNASGPGGGGQSCTTLRNQECSGYSTTKCYNDSVEVPCSDDGANTVRCWN